MTDVPAIDWWEVTNERAFEVGASPHISGMSAGWDRVVDLARDTLARPHLTTSADRLRLECREAAELLAEITREDGNTLFLAECLRAIIMNAARDSASSGRNP